MPSAIHRCRSAGCGILAAVDAEFLDPDAEFYRRYLETCRRLGVEPVTREQVRPLVGEWNRLVHGVSDATTTQ